ncbi:hypothetical protein ACE1CC_35245 [Aerosakkonemataceae cyanobacterium BLCC-F46]|uniref:Uncharacterized protein n=1 Tax=Floridaenema aerugineum BLCC-F46 TaxID=3153654 RepID=A0ABV4XHI8_9CYAN
MKSARINQEAVKVAKGLTMNKSSTATSQIQSRILVELLHWRCEKLKALPFIQVGS